MYNVGIRTKDLMQGILRTMPLRYQRAFHGDIMCQYKLYVLDIRRWSRRAPGPGHDVTGPDVDLNFPDTHSSCGTGLRMTDVAMDSRPTEKQAPAGELAGFTALGTHEACQSPICSPALLRVWTGWTTCSTCHECRSCKQESADGPRHCISCH